MTSVLFDLFDEYAVAYARGERPDLREFLARAGPEAAELAEVVDRWLEATPAPMPDVERVELMRAWVRGEPPLLALRTRRSMKRDTVVDSLLGLLSLDQAKRAKVKRYYHELEAGTLEPAGVSKRVWEALTSIFDADVRTLADWRPRPLHAAPAFRSDEPLPELVLRRMSAPEHPGEEDEVDVLFRSGR